MSFASYHSVAQRPRQILPDGAEDRPFDTGRWALFQQAEQGREALAAAERPAETEEATAPAERTPQKVIDTLFAARGELDVILDLVTTMEQQQFVALAHVPHVPDPAAAAQQARLKLGQRWGLLKSAAARLRSGVEAARHQVQASDRFFEDLVEIRKEWRLDRRSVAAGGAFFVDFSAAEQAGADASSVGRKGAKDMQATILPAADGTACAAAASGGGTARGGAAICADLRQRQIAHALREVDRLVHAADAQQDGTDSTEQNGDGALAALKRLAERAAAAVGEGAFDAADENTTLPVMPPAQQGMSAADIAAFCSTAACQSQFEAQALRCLAASNRTARTPSLVRDARKGTSPALMQSLLVWLRHAALLSAVELSLARQAAALRLGGRYAEVRRQPTLLGDLSAAWRIVVDGSTMGIVVLSSSDGLEWRGSSTTAAMGGGGVLLGRWQLDGLLQRVASGANSDSHKSYLK